MNESVHFRDLGLMSAPPCADLLGNIVYNVERVNRAIRALADGKAPPAGTTPADLVVAQCRGRARRLFR